jgi:hypothetical protein
MLEALEPLLAAQWAKVRVYAEGEALKMAQTLVIVASLRRTDQINDAQAEGLIDIQRHAARTVLLTIEGIGLASAERAVDALLAAVRDRFNGAVPSPLL